MDNNNPITFINVSKHIQIIIALHSFAKILFLSIAFTLLKLNQVEQPNIIKRWHIFTMSPVTVISVAMADKFSKEIKS